MAKSITDRLVDKRIVERNITKGLLDRKAHDKYVAGLTDRADNHEIVDIEALDDPPKLAAASEDEVDGETETETETETEDAAPTEA